MSQTDKPLASSKNTKTIVPFGDMPEEYVLIDREDADQYRGAQEIFTAHPDAKTLLLLYAKDGDLRSAYELLKSAERGTIIPPEVFMYATAMEAMKAGEEFESGFVEGLKSKAQLASENAVYRQMMETRQVSLSRDMMVLSVDTDDLKVYRAGSVLRGTPDNPVEYRVYQENQEKG
ncbi:hypothetical protein [Acidithiobacillus sp.]